MKSNDQNKPSPNLPLSTTRFQTTNQFFPDLLQISPVAPDGNCLFRAILRATKQDDSNHMELRTECVAAVINQWDRYSLQADVIHKVAWQAWLGRRGLVASAGPDTRLSPVDYKEYMLQSGNWGSDLEALAIAQLMQRPALIWTLATGGHGEHLNYSPMTKTRSAIQILHAGNHYEALLINDELNVQQLSRLALSVSGGYIDLNPQSNLPAINPVAINLKTLANDLAVPLKGGVSKRSVNTADLSCNVVEIAMNLNFPQSCKRPRSTRSRKKFAFNLPAVKCKTSLKRSRPIFVGNQQAGLPAPNSNLMPTYDFMQHDQLYPVPKSARLANQSSRLSKKDSALSSPLATDTLKPLTMTLLQAVDGSYLSTFRPLHCPTGQSDSKRSISVISSLHVFPNVQKAPCRSFD
jgi:hypothetical protein